jgi:hypothetical protein
MSLLSSFCVKGFSVRCVKSSIKENDGPAALGLPEMPRGQKSKAGDIRMKYLIGYLSCILFTSVCLHNDTQTQTANVSSHGPEDKDYSVFGDQTHHKVRTEHHLHIQSEKAAGFRVVGPLPAAKLPHELKCSHREKEEQSDRQARAAIERFYVGRPWGP